MTDRIAPSTVPLPGAASSDLFAEPAIPEPPADDADAIVGGVRWVANAYDGIVQAEIEALDGAMQGVEHRLDALYHRLQGTGGAVAQTAAVAVDAVQGAVSAGHGLVKGAIDMSQGLQHLRSPLDWALHTDENLQRATSVRDTAIALNKLGTPLGWLLDRQGNTRTAEALWDGVSQHYVADADEGRWGRFGGRAVVDVGLACGSLAAVAKGLRGASAAAGLGRAAEHAAVVTARTLPEVVADGSKVAEVVPIPRAAPNAVLLDWQASGYFDGAVGPSDRNNITKALQQLEAARTGIEPPGIAAIGRNEVPGRSGMVAPAGEPAAGVASRSRLVMYDQSIKAKRLFEAELRESIWSGGDPTMAATRKYRLETHQDTLRNAIRGREKEFHGVLSVDDVQALTQRAQAMEQRIAPLDARLVSETDPLTRRALEGVIDTDRREIERIAQRLQAPDQALAIPPRRNGAAGVVDSQRTQLDQLRRRYLELGDTLAANPTDSEAARLLDLNRQQITKLETGTAKREQSLASPREEVRSSPRPAREPAPKPLSGSQASAERRRLALEESMALDAQAATAEPVEAATPSRVESVALAARRAEAADRLASWTPEALSAALSGARACQARIAEHMNMLLSSVSSLRPVVNRTAYEFEVLADQTNVTEQVQALADLAVLPDPPADLLKAAHEAAGALDLSLETLDFNVRRVKSVADELRIEVDSARAALKEFLRAHPKPR
jgi:hypothetical protein